MFLVIPVPAIIYSIKTIIQYHQLGFQFLNISSSPNGDDIFKNYLNKINQKNFTSNLLYGDIDEDVFSILSVVPNAYKDWLLQQEGRIQELSEEHSLIAQKISISEDKI